MATVISNAVFAAITGISIALAAVFARGAVPEMVRAGYDRRIALGVVAGSSVLGMLIPPSLLLTPLLGLSVFVVQATLKDEGVTVGEVFRGAAPFAAVMAGVLVVVILWPPVVLAILGR